MAAGADLIIGNHAYFAQELEWVDDVPVFYSLGHTASEHKSKTNFNYLVEIDVEHAKLREIRVLPGKMEQGSLTFDLTAADQDGLEQMLQRNFPDRDGPAPVTFSY